MASVRTGKGVATSVPQPSEPKFVHGTWPPSPTMPKNTIKPNKPSKRDYGKIPPLSGDTGMSGLS